MIAVGCGFVLATASISYGAGVTIITHGWNPDLSGTPSWLGSMRDDIAENFLGNEQNYGTITVTKSGTNLVATCSPWDFDVDSGTTGEILIVLSWSSIADHLTGGPSAQDVAAVVIDKLVTSQNGKRPLAELPVHLIGHSRGGGMVCELARLLGERGVVVDHLTPLDPHPLTSSDLQRGYPFPDVIDTPAAIYENVIFADVYSQTNEYPEGQYLAGGYNRLWDLMSGGYYDTILQYENHRNVYLMYQGTIELDNPVHNGEAPMDVTERAAWFNMYEDSGDDTGFTYSRIDGGADRTVAYTPVAGGDEVRDGLHDNAFIGGDGARTALTWSSAVWPNVAQFDVLTNGTAMGSGTYALEIGSTQQVRIVYLDYDSECTVILRLDVDRNPYNGNDIATLFTQVYASATGGDYAQDTVDWDTTGLDSRAEAYAYASVTDGTRTRYIYASPILQLYPASDSDNDGMDDLWENDHGLTVGVDDSAGNPDNDPHSNVDEFIADTDPTDSNDYFRITYITVASPPVVSFESSSNRWYTLVGCSNLIEGGWTNVPGSGPRVGLGSADTLTDTNEPPRGPFYRLTVELP